MNKKGILIVVVLSVIVICVGLFIWNKQREEIYAQTREIVAPVYDYSGRLTPEELKSYSEFAVSIEKVDPKLAKKLVLPKRESLKLEAHSMSLYQNNPELFFIPEGTFSTDTDVKPFQRNCGIRALTAKTKLADFPADSRSKLFQHLDTLNKRLVINSVESAIVKHKENEDGTSTKFPINVFGVESYTDSGASQLIFQEDGSVKIPEEHKRGIINITDVYGNKYTIDLDSNEDISMTEDTNELYTEIDQLFDHLTDTEFQRLSKLSKTELDAEIDKLISLE